MNLSGRLVLGSKTLFMRAIPVLHPPWSAPTFHPEKKQPKSALKIQPKNGCIDDAMIYVHAKFGVAQILCKEGKKKRHRHMNRCRLWIHMNSTPNPIDIPILSFLFLLAWNFVQSQILHIIYALTFLVEFFMYFCVCFMEYRSISRGVKN